MKEYEVSKDTFIGGWYIPEDVCDWVVDYFKINKDRQSKGKVYNEEQGGPLEDINYKQSTELGVHPEDFEDPIATYRAYQQKVLKKYIEKYPDVDFLLDAFNINTPYNIQRYEPNQGFYKLHCERTCLSFTRRVLVFMTYLNDVPNGGTEFPNQKIITPARKGLTLIWPSDWTHAHKGQISPTTEKYIMTGWYTFNE